MEEGSLSRTLEFNYGHSYTQEEYAMKRNSTMLNKWLKNLRNGQCLCAWGVKILIFMNALQKTNTHLMTPFQDNMGKPVSET